MSKLNLLCLPYSGGSRYSFSSFIKYAPTWFSPVVLELPGRGKRAQEMLLEDIEEIEEDIFKQALPYINKPYALYGHSMGGLLTYLLTKRILRDALRIPVCLFVTGARAPSSMNSIKCHHFNKREFRERIRSLDGIPDEIFNNEELMNYFEPIIRADFKALENYIYEPSEPINIPITVMFGDKEDIKKEEVEAWKMISTADVSIIKFTGGHFFINDHASHIFDFIEKRTREFFPIS
jgi:surfactin synthase thioesterase subunit